MYYTFFCPLMKIYNRSYFVIYVIIIPLIINKRK